MGTFKRTYRIILDFETESSDSFAEASNEWENSTTQGKEDHSLIALLLGRISPHNPVGNWGDRPIFRAKRFQIVEQPKEDDEMDDPPFGGSLARPVYT